MPQIVLAILGLSAVVIVHEAGHYLTARAVGIRVARFSIGIGPVIMRYRPQGSPTVFQVCAIPFLAYVMYDNPEQADPNDASLYANANVWARTLTVVGGPLANYLAASIMILALALSGWRVNVPSEPLVIDEVEAGSPAAHAGLQSGDVIVEANGRAVRNVDEFRAAMAARAGQPTDCVIVRDGQRLPTLRVTSRAVDGRAVIGIMPHEDTRYRKTSLGGALKLAATVPLVLTLRNVEGIIDLIQKRSTEGLTGPVGMGKLVAQQAGKGVYDYVSILVMISIALGYFNLLPLPGLDGGKLVFLGYEIITRRKPSPRMEAVIHTAGLVCLLGLVALVTLRDVGG